MSGLSPAARAARKTFQDPYSRGVWLGGDHHIHTKYSIDGRYEVGQQVALAQRNGLDFCVITDHGGPTHTKVVATKAYEELLQARKDHPGIVVFQGLEWNIPAAEHGSIIVPPTADEARLVAEFERRFDGKNGRLSEADATDGVRYLETLPQKPLFFANHPARRGLDSPHELRAWADAGPHVMRGFEGAPGHAAATFSGELRGHYSDRPSEGSFAGYPSESYRTHGGYDYYTSQVGGLWDALLSEGRPFYITCNSDSHHHHGDMERVQTQNFRSEGHVSRSGQQVAWLPGVVRPDTDYSPGIYTATRVFADSRDPLAILAAMRSGNMFTCLGGLIDSFRCYLHDGEQAVPMGGFLRTRRGANLELVVEIEPAQTSNLGGYFPVLDHVDLIVGQVLPHNPNRDNWHNPTARVLRRVRAAHLTRHGTRLLLRHRFSRVDHSFYVRLRGTNTDVAAPQSDPPHIDPWSDLWFYGNPIFALVAE